MRDRGLRGWGGQGPEVSRVGVWGMTSNLFWQALSFGLSARPETLNLAHQTPTTVHQTPHRECKSPNPLQAGPNGPSSATRRLRHDTGTLKSETPHTKPLPALVSEQQSIRTGKSLRAFERNQDAADSGLFSNFEAAHHVYKTVNIIAI